MDHMLSTDEFVDLQFSCGIGMEQWSSIFGPSNQGLQPHGESGAPHFPFVTPSPLLHFFIFLPYVPMHIMYTHTHTHTYTYIEVHANVYTCWNYSYNE